MLFFSYAYFSYEVRSDSRQETREQRQTTDQTRDHTREQTRDRDERGDLDERQTRPKTRPNTREEVTGPFRICICGGNLAGARTTFVILILGRCVNIWHILVTKGLERFGVRELASMSAAGRDLCKLRELRRWCRALPGHHARSRPSSA